MRLIIAGEKKTVFFAQAISLFGVFSKLWVLGWNLSKVSLVKLCILFMFVFPHAKSMQLVRLCPFPYGERSFGKFIRLDPAGHVFVCF